MNLGKPIGKGWTSEVYPWKEGQVLKLYHKSIPEDFIKYELEATKFAHEAGLPVPKVTCVIEEVNNRLGFCLERVEGISLLDLMVKNPYTRSRYYRRMVELLAEIHKLSGVGLSCYKQTLTKRIKDIRFLSRKLREDALTKISVLNEGDKLCHGDFSPNNIMVTEDDKFILIDWSHARCGNPVTDASRSIIIGKIFDDPWVHRYINYYLSLTEITWEELQPWIPVVATSLIYDIPFKRKQLKLIAKEGLEYDPTKVYENSSTRV